MAIADESLLRDTSARMIETRLPRARGESMMRQAAQGLAALLYLAIAMQGKAGVTDEIRGASARPTTEATRSAQYIETPDANPVGIWQRVGEPTPAGARDRVVQERGTPLAQARPRPNASAFPGGDLQFIVGRWLMVNSAESMAFRQGADGIEASTIYGPAALRISNGEYGSNVSLKASELSCYYRITIIDKDRMIWTLRGGDPQCQKSDVLAREQ